MTTNHTLQHKWTFYLHYPIFSMDTRNYSSQAYDKICDFSSVERFWEILETFPKPSDVFSRKDASSRRIVKSKINGRYLEAFGLFKTGPRPEWEDPLNLKGGHWECRKDFDLDLLDRLWYEIVLALVGEVLEDGRDLIGARVVDKSKTKRTEYRLEIWISTVLEAERCEILRRLVKVLIPYDESLEFSWKNHGDSLNTALWCNAEELGINKNKDL